MKSTKIPPSIPSFQTTAKPAPSYSQPDELQNKYSGCHPEISPKQAKRRRKAIPLNIRVTKVMRVVGIGLLHALRDDLWADADELTAGIFSMHFSTCSLAQRLSLCARTMARWISKRAPVC